VRLEERDVEKQKKDLYKQIRKVTCIRRNEPSGTRGEKRRRSVLTQNRGRTGLMKRRARDAGWCTEKPRAQDGGKNVLSCPPKTAFDQYNRIGSDGTSCLIVKSGGRRFFRKQKKNMEGAEYLATHGGGGTDHSKFVVEHNAKNNFPREA